MPDELNALASAASPASAGEVEETLDPGDWQAVRELAHRSLDDILDHLATVRERPVWTELPPAIRERLQDEPPWQGQGLEAVYEEFGEVVKPYALGNIHPRFWGWVPGSGTVGGVVAELLKAGLNSAPAAFDEFGRSLEQQVMAWMLEVFGMPADGSGILVSGGSVANFVGLAVARDARAGFDVRRDGLAAAPRSLAVYASVETHSSVDKAIQLLGIGREGLRKVPVDREHRVDVAALAEAVARDREAGLRPVAVIGNAGTVNTGAIDDLTALADLAAAEDLWFHVDGAFGAIAMLSPELAPRLAGIERADSLAFDLHKWMHVQYCVGCTLFRDEAANRAAFTVPASYLSAVDRGPGAQARPSHQYGPELSREAKALKVWMSLKEHGLAKFGRLVRQNVEQARTLARMVEAEPRLELLAPVPLNIVCLRYVPGGAASAGPRGQEVGDDAPDRAGAKDLAGDALGRAGSENQGDDAPDRAGAEDLDRDVAGRARPEDLDALNREVLMRLQEQGIAVPSHTVIDGRFAIRVCITSHRTRHEDLELVVREIVRIGGEVEG